MSLTSDGACPNRRFYRMCQPQPQKRNMVPYKTCNPFRDKEELFFICDVPHLLKTARNCFSNSFAHSCKRKMEVRKPRLFANVAFEHCTHLNTEKWSGD